MNPSTPTTASSPTAGHAGATANEEPRRCNAERVAWIEAAVQALKVGPLSACPPFVVTVGWPSKKARRNARGSMALGECVPNATPDGKCYVTLHPILFQEGSGPGAAVKALAVLLHEMCHVKDGCKSGHRGAFITLARGVGLVAPWTATTPGPELHARLVNLAEHLPPFPAGPAELPPSRKKQGTRMLKLECACGRIVRASREVAEGPVIACGGCQAPFALVEP